LSLGGDIIFFDEELVVDAEAGGGQAIVLLMGRVTGGTPNKSLYLIKKSIDYEPSNELIVISLKS
jgi:hypothetical protein